MIKKITSISTALLAFGLANPLYAESASGINEALQAGDFSFKTRTFYFQRDFDDSNIDTAKALTAGGIMKYQSGSFHGVQLGLAYYGSHSLGIVDRADGNNTSNLQSDGSDIQFLGEAYLKYSHDMFNVTYGRQRLSTPLMNDHDLRTLPAAYKGLTAQVMPMKGILLEGGVIDSYSGFVSKGNAFTDQQAAWGESGLGYVYGKYSSDMINARAQFVKTIDDKGGLDNIVYVDGKVSLDGMGEKTYVKAQYGATSYTADGADTGVMFGLKAGTSMNIVDVALLYNAVQDNPFNAVRSGPMYSDWQQGYSNRDPSTAIGAQVVVHPMEKLSIKGGFVQVSADDDIADANIVDDFSEFNLDVKYKISDVAKARVRYSLKDASTDAEDAGSVDQNDFRIIFYYNF